MERLVASEQHLFPLAGRDHWPLVGGIRGCQRRCVAAPATGLLCHPIKSFLWKERP
jgi:hypothetical protein